MKIVVTDPIILPENCKQKFGTLGQLEEALIEALRKKRIASAALDVFEKEPLPAHNPLLELDNPVITPHIAYLSEETISKCSEICLENVEMFLRNQPQNAVNPSVLRQKI
jgi:phosphoglycerate dehydrogenase-like enzyme